MKLAGSGLLAAAFLLVSCSTTKKAAVTTFHVIDAPANYIRHHLDEGDHPTTTTTTTTSDVTTPGNPVPVTPPPPRRTTTSSPTTATQTTSPRPSPPRSQAAAQQQTQSFPTAKPVPGKPGFVISPYDSNGGYVDVTGYPSGSKAKDPYSQKIFIVP